MMGLIKPGVSICSWALPPILLSLVALYYVGWMNSLLSLVEHHWCNGEGLLALAKMVDSGAGSKVKFSLDCKVSMLDKAVEKVKEIYEQP